MVQGLRQSDLAPLSRLVRFCANVLFSTGCLDGLYGSGRSADLSSPNLDPAARLLGGRTLRFAGNRPPCQVRMAAMPQGVIKKIVSDRGFGFISQANGVDVFFHHSSVVDQGFDNLQEGQSVEYEIDKGDSGGRRGGKKGPRAVDVKPV